MNRIRTLMVSIAVPVGAVVLAACGSSGGSSSAPPAAAPSSSSAVSGGTAAVKTAAVGNLGTILVNAQGMTLYRFDADSNNPPTSNCNGSCATYWPPLLAGAGMPQVQGVSASLLGTVTRSDGTKQVTLAGWPLYTYAGDNKSGDANGQDKNLSGGLWWAVTPTGQRAAGAATSPGASSSGSSGNGVGGY